MTLTTPLPGPVGEGRRIASLDVLRGFALLGVLVANMGSYGTRRDVFLLYPAFLDLSAWDSRVWVALHVLVEGKFISIFSMLFGAGIVLMTQRSDATDRGTAALHYRRMAGLLAIGLLHAHLIWYGDILFAYAVCGMAVYPLRKLRARYLFLIGLLVWCVPAVVFPDGVPGIYHPPSGSVSPFEARAFGPEYWARTGPWIEQYDFRLFRALHIEIFVLIGTTFWTCSGRMLIGAALLKAGVLSAQRSMRFYLALVLLGLALPVPPLVLHTLRGPAVEWTHTLVAGRYVNDWLSLPMALGWIGLVMAWCRSGLLGRLAASLGAVGRMALTNYLSQSVMCTFIFYGHGLALFTVLSLTEMQAVALALFALQVVWSRAWLDRFAFGPVEWVWRTVTYRRLQVMPRAAGTS
jgi:uncharacterized protein